MKHGLAKRLTTLFLAMVLVLSCGAVDIVAYATTADTYVAWIGETGYPSLTDATKAAANLTGDVTIRLAAGTHSLDFGNNEPFANKTQNLIFEGAGRDQSVWLIGEDESFGDHKATITFRNMTLQVTGNYMCGFKRSNNMIVDNCIVDCSGGTFHYWGNGTATFQNSLFRNAGEYVMWTYGPHTINITGCTFNNITNGVLNVFRYIPGVTVNFTGNTVNAQNSSSTMITIADASSGTNQWTVNIADNTITGFGPSASTCSKLFEVNEYRIDKNDPDSAYKYGLGTPAIVKLEGKTVWQNGIWANGRHDGMDGDGNLYTYGHAEYPNNIERIYVDKDGNKLDNDSYHNENGVMVRHWVDRCKYCGFVYDKDSETQPTSATVTFKVVNGQWDDGTTEDKTVDVDLTDGKGTLMEGQIPSVGAKPNENYKAGSWDVTPNISADGITENVTYTYTYVAKVSVVPVDPSIPQTGDESHILLWGAMMIASMVGMAVLIVSKKRFAYSGKYIR